MIQLTDKLAVAADENQYIVGVSTTGIRNGVECARINRPKYFTTLSGAVKCAVSIAMREKVATSEITTLRDFAAEYEQITAEFEKALQPLEC